MINKVILVGNLGKDPEIKHFEGNGAVAKFSVATNENYKDKTSGEWVQQTEWHNVVVWNALAERVERTLKKGMLVYIEGKLTHRKYQDNNGVDKYITEVVGRTLRTMEKREEGSGSYNSSMPTAQDAPKAVSQATPANNTNTESAADDLPF